MGEVGELSAQPIEEDAEIERDVDNGRGKINVGGNGEFRTSSPPLQLADAVVDEKVDEISERRSLLETPESTALDGRQTAMRYPASGDRAKGKIQN
ncbi:hypothetical protein DRE_02768 [Drechslerella stenobrocha 248]|uniref:Uncharacterized protein n=1 Tax=Drechslerella stenobrocha 248 TaxID=1043628 RepID=W7HUK5_9PEZI|nr:hypothetical protein DRE_02768 [Drechslerella stenobrocha 248]